MLCPAVVLFLNLKKEHNSLGKARMDQTEFYYVSVQIN